MFCRSCGVEVNENQAVCMKCGVAIGNGNNYCPNCGNQTNSEAAICVNCGVALKEAENVGNLGDKYKMTAGILAIFLGGFGVHNFYLGESKKGILKILLCWTGISSILALIDAIKIFTDKYEINSEKFI